MLRIICGGAGFFTRRGAAEMDHGSKGGIVYEGNAVRRAPALQVTLINDKNEVSPFISTRRLNCPIKKPSPGATPDDKQRKYGGGNLRQLSSRPGHYDGLRIYPHLNGDMAVSLCAASSRPPACSIERRVG